MLVQRTHISLSYSYGFKGGSRAGFLYFFFNIHFFIFYPFFPRWARSRSGLGRVYSFPCMKTVRVVNYTLVLQSMDQRGWVVMDVLTLVCINSWDAHREMIYSLLVPIAVYRLWRDINARLIWDYDLIAENAIS